MLKVTLDEENSIAILEPKDSLTKSDFDEVVRLIDPFIEKNGKLNGIIIEAESFPGWANFSAMSRHFTFIKNHHKKIKRLAFVTDSLIGDVAETISGHFVQAEIKTFPYGNIDEAKSWIMEAA